MTRGVRFAECGLVDLLIVGPARSGTTMLANLLTSPPNRWVLVEPGITRGGMGEVVRQEAGLFGWKYERNVWHEQETSEERFARVLYGRLKQLDRWGVKEVNMHGIADLISTYRPRHIVISVRDIRACAISVRQKEDLQGTIAGQALVPKSDEWLQRRLLDGAEAALRLANEPPQGSKVTVVRYEDFVASADARASLARTLDWPLDGDPSSTLDLFGRSYEVQRHGNNVGMSSVSRWRRETEPEMLAFAEGLAADAARYQAAFGYTA
jgi:hypothetical protein